MIYKVNTVLKPANLAGISKEQIAQHWKLYEGYVEQVNALREELDTLRGAGKTNTPDYADRRRRLGFEYNGMVLHEYYFGNLRSGVPEPGNNTILKKALNEAFGTFESFKQDFVSAGASRSVGWAILYFDAATGAMNNHFIQLHEDGNVAGFVPILVMDVWEHAYMVDFGASGRGEYIKAFFGNIDWPVVEKRLADAREHKLPERTRHAA